MKQRILTGDRPTGEMHLGHYFGSLQNRVQLQNDYETFIIIADWQVLYDHIQDEKGKIIKENIKNVLLGNLASGLNPNYANFFVQSEIPQICELTMIFQFLVTIARAKRNPTVKSEMQKCGFSDTEFDKINVGFLAFPISQAADILCVKANLVPVGEDQLAHIEQTIEIAEKFNKLFGTVFPIPKGLVSQTPRIVGIDGNAKMSKSLGNVINLNSTQEQVDEIIKKAYTGENCALFDYEKLIDKNVDLQDLKDQHKKGLIKFSTYKPYLAKKINDFLKPFREKRQYYEQKPELLKEILESGNKKVRDIAQQTLQQVKENIKMNYKW